MTQLASMDDERKATVFVVGEGFSAALGFPVGDSALIELYERIDSSLEERIRNFFRHRHDMLDLSDCANASLESLLTELLLMEYWATGVSKNVRCPFTHEYLVTLRRDVLLAMTKLFYQLQRNVRKKPPEWLSVFVSWILQRRAAVISFNWDLVLDELMFGSSLDRRSYGFPLTLNTPVLLKPQGSINWYGFDGVRGQADTCFRLCGVGKQLVQTLKDFKLPQLYPDPPGKPLVFPSAYLNHVCTSPFKEVGIGCIERIGAADRVVFLGYSMPVVALNAQSILRWGFHNNARDREQPCEVVVVQSDNKTTRRIAGVVGPKCETISERPTVSSWILDELAPATAAFS